MRRRKISEEELDKMISDAVVDCYDEEEEFMGILYTVEAGMSFPYMGLAELEIEPDDAENAKWLEMYHYWLERY